jgi:hypothetical protein
LRASLGLVVVRRPSWSRAMAGAASRRCDLTSPCIGRELQEHRNSVVLDQNVRPVGARNSSRAHFAPIPARCSWRAVPARPRHDCVWRLDLRRNSLTTQHCRTRVTSPYELARWFRAHNTAAESPTAIAALLSAFQTAAQFGSRSALHAMQEQHKSSKRYSQSTASQIRLHKFVPSRGFLLHECRTSYAASDVLTNIL